MLQRFYKNLMSVGVNCSPFSEFLWSPGAKPVTQRLLAHWSPSVSLLHSPSPFHLGLVIWTSSCPKNPESGNKAAALSSGCKVLLPNKSPPRDHITVIETQTVTHSHPQHLAHSLAYKKCSGNCPSLIQGYGSACCCTRMSVSCPLSEPVNAWRFIANINHGNSESLSWDLRGLSNHKIHKKTQKAQIVSMTCLSHKSTIKRDGLSVLVEEKLDRQV